MYHVRFTFVYGLTQVYPNNNSIISIRIIIIIHFLFSYSSILISYSLILIHTHAHARTHTHTHTHTLHVALPFISLVYPLLLCGNSDNLLVCLDQMSTHATDPAILYTSLPNHFVSCNHLLYLTTSYQINISIFSCCSSCMLSACNLNTTFTVNH